MNIEAMFKWATILAKLAEAIIRIILACTSE
jgi:hypothetical protein